MLVKFRTTELARCFESRKDRTRAWGEKVAGLFVRRIQTLQAAQSTQELRENPALRFHPLHGPMKGLHAIWIDATWRITLRFEGESAVIVEEVSKHYGGTST